MNAIQSAPRRRVLRAGLTITAALAASGCSATGVLNSLEPRAGLKRSVGLAYGEGPRRRLDVYAPAPGADLRPTVMFFYGGGWDSGARGAYAFASEALARKGFVVMTPDYRIFPEARYPDFLEDCAQAAAWGRANAQRFGGDARRLTLVGHSAGAYNAMMLALDPRWLGAVGMTPSRDLAAVVGLAGPYDFLPLRSERLREIFGVSGQERDSQPIAHVSPGAPPVFLGCDTGDRVVEPANTQRLTAALLAAGDRVETRYYKGLSHALMIGAFAAPLRFLAPVLDDVAGFINANANAGGVGRGAS